MKTTVYFVRHAEPNYNNHSDSGRELTAKGLRDRRLATEFLKARGVQVVVSSPFKRAYDTVKEYADLCHLPIEVIDDFRERRVDSVWIDDFNAFARRQWADFDYKLSDGESLREVQARNIAALKQLIQKYDGQTVAVGSHGTAMCAIINYFDPTFGHEDFKRIQQLMPWIVRFEFTDGRCAGIEQYDVFELRKL